MATFQAKYEGKECEREKIKIFVPFRYVPTRRIRENSPKKEKIKKYRCGIISSQNRLEKAEKKRK